MQLSTGNIGVEVRQQFGIIQDTLSLKEKNKCYTYFEFYDTEEKNKGHFSNILYAITL